ncbi:MAG: hypothetical protein HY558_06295 [Euryarchaeota archaeon]|nr:hypothetical protein [Euryarchaeota archaeon]
MAISPAALAGPASGFRGRAGQEPPIPPLYLLTALAITGGLLLWKRRAITTRLRRPKTPP